MRKEALSRNTIIILFVLVCSLLFFYNLEQRPSTTDSSLPKVTDLAAIYLEYQRYVSTGQIKCQNEARCGPKGESGYAVCNDEQYKPREPCLVYSFGSHFIFGFENGVMKNFKCEIHTFDPSIPVAGHHIPEGIQFHLLGLSDTDSTNNLGWEMRQLSTIRKYLNHTERVLDVLKLDIEGSEWNSIPNIISSGEFSFVKQLVIEFHFGKVKRSRGKDGYITVRSNYWGNVKPSEQLEVLKQLEQSGFRVFHFEPNSRTKIRVPTSLDQSIFTCNVISLINTHFKTK